MLTIIIPTYQAEADLARLLPQLNDYPVIIADGGSTDQTLTIAAKHGARLALGMAGRGHQLRLGAQLAVRSGHSDDWFLFLHADSQMETGWMDVVAKAMQQSNPRYFKFKADQTGASAWIMNRMVHLRCWALGLPYGDQGLLISRKLYEQVEGYNEMPLFEDVDMIERLKRISKLKPLPLAIRTDVSKYQREGLWSRGVSNLRLLWRYKCGANVETLLREYGA